MLEFASRHCSLPSSVPTAAAQPRPAALITANLMPPQPVSQRQQAVRPGWGGQGTVGGCQVACRAGFETAEAATAAARQGEQAANTSTQECRNE